jgi:deoxycytidylate deaminase
VGAALFDGARIVTLGFNRHKSHPDSTCFTQHAEFDSVRRMKWKNTANLVMYVARLTRTDKISLARPCTECQSVLLQAGIKKVFFTNHCGELEELIFDREVVLA